MPAAAPARRISQRAAARVSFVGGEYRRPDQIVDPLFPEAFFIQNPDVIPIERQHPFHRLLQQIHIVADHGFTSLILEGPVHGPPIL